MTPTEIVLENIGQMGRMIAAVKYEYAHKHPGNLVVFNANLFVDGQKVWYGDLDVTKDEKKLQKCANLIGKPILILREMDGRFERESNPALDKAVATFNPLG